MEDEALAWRVRAIRGATTADDDSIEAIRIAVDELLQTIEEQNKSVLALSEVVSVTFSVTGDLKAIYPAAIARQRQGWKTIPLSRCAAHVQRGGFTIVYSLLDSVQYMQSC